MSNARNRRRTPIPPTTKQVVLIEAGYMCANPRCRRTLALEIHHIIWVRDDGGNEPSNLLALCPYCHALHTRGDIPSAAIRVWKGMLLSLNSTTRANVDVLLYLYRQSKDSVGQHIRYTGDTVLQLAPLLNAGLIKRGSAEVSSGGMGFPPFSSFQIELTDVGSMLVEAWLAGDEANLSEALRSVDTPDY